MTHPAPPCDWDLAASDERAGWLKHIASCPDCRDNWIDGDASRLFNLLSDEPAADADREQETLDRLSENIHRQIGADRFPARWYRLAAAAVLAMALLAPAAAWLFRDRPVPAVQTASFPLADVEVLSTPGDAQIIDLSVGDTQVVMIFDSRLEL